jgi:Tfp pilus assembly protein PilW
MDLNAFRGLLNQNQFGLNQSQGIDFSNNPRQFNQGFMPMAGKYAPDLQQEAVRNAGFNNMINGLQFNSYPNSQNINNARDLFNNMPQYQEIDSGLDRFSRNRNMPPIQIEGIGSMVNGLQQMRNY